MTGSIRLFVEQDLQEGAALQASPEQAHYLGHVMRKAAGASLLLFNGRDGEFQASIGAIRKDRASLVVGGLTRPQAVEPAMTLVFALLKRDQTDLVIEKATELGATLIQPVFTERTNAGRVNEQRLAAIAREAAEQCERLSVPRIAAPRRLYDVLGDWPAGQALAAAIERQAEPAQSTGAPRALLVGPEGGFTPGELDAFRRLAFVEPICLGHNILRAETACIAGLALLQDRVAR